MIKMEGIITVGHLADSKGSILDILIWTPQRLLKAVINYSQYYSKRKFGVSISNLRIIHTLLFLWWFYCTDVAYEPLLSTLTITAK